MCAPAAAVRAEGVPRVLRGHARDAPFFAATPQRQKDRREAMQAAVEEAQHMYMELSGEVRSATSRLAEAAEELGSGLSSAALARSISAMQRA